jgi:hypothetical protein
LRYFSYHFFANPEKLRIFAPNKKTKTMAAEELREAKNRIAYTVMIVRDFGEAHHLNPRQAHNYLRRHKAMDYMEQFYDVEHTLSPKDTIATLNDIAKRNGGQEI